MRRVSLLQEFHGEPDMDQEGLEVAGVGPDEVTIDVKQGILKLRVPIETPDNDVISKKFLDRFVEAILELEDGSGAHHHYRRGARWYRHPPADICRARDRQGANGVSVSRPGRSRTRSARL